MMTSLSGKRGIGKTYHLAKEVYKRYQQGFFCITNFSHVYSHVDCSKMTPDEFYVLLREVLQFKEAGFEMIDLFPAFRHTGIFIAIDEGHLYFSADMWKRYQDEDGFQDIIKLLAQARKQDVEIWYTTQDPAKVDKNWRRYTEDWVRYTPFWDWSRKIMVPHDEKPIFKREVRYPIPLVWQEIHNLDHANPAFNYATISDEDGYKHWSPQSTLIRRHLVLSGWLDPFPYRLYDSNQVLACHMQDEARSFDGLRSHFSWVDHSYRYERYPTLKKLLRRPAWDAKLPTRLRFHNLQIHGTAATSLNINVLRQPEEFVDMVSFARTHKALCRGVGIERASSAPIPPHGSAFTSRTVE